MSDLVECAPYHCRLALDVCVKRHLDAQKPARSLTDARSGPSPLLHFTACRTCDVGRKRAGVSTEVAPPTDEPHDPGGGGGAEPR